MSEPVRESVMLVGGPLDGQRRRIAPATNHYFEEWEAGRIDRVYGGRPVSVVQVQLATYRRAGPDVFRCVRTQVDLGDLDGVFRERQERIEGL